MTSLGVLDDLFPESLRPFLAKATALGFTPVLVGGAVRDLLLGSTNITDWDFELHHPQGSDSVWSKLQHQLQADYRLHPQPHGVVKAQAGTCEFEFALPRVETYPVKEAYAHSDFTSRSVFKISFQEAAQRRDFTLNAMGAAFVNDQWELWDPFNGVEALKAKELRPCNAVDFAKDPVRWVRAHRFAMKFQLKFSAELEEMLDQMDLEHLSAHYVSEEAQKSGEPFRFWNKLQDAESLPTRFHGGLAHPEKMEACFQRYITKLGFSNAILTGVFFTNEGWHLLLPLGGKGEKEVSTWRERRELIRQLQNQTPESIQQDLGAFEMLCRLTKAPLQWLREEWVIATLSTLGLDWVATRAWPTIELSEVPPAERHQAKVMAWLKS